MKIILTFVILNEIEYISFNLLKQSGMCKIWKEENNLNSSVCYEYPTVDFTWSLLFETCVYK